MESIEFHISLHEVSSSPEHSRENDQSEIHENKRISNQLRNINNLEN